jgi:dTDP-glucose 4,6-dehydratase
MQNVLITGGAGFIGSAVVRLLVGKGVRVINLDKLTDSSNLASLKGLESASNHRFVHGDISDVPLVLSLLREEQIEGIMHLAAESHVDRSIEDPATFIETNVVGTFRLLSAALEYWRRLEGEAKANFRVHQISTDEVFGDLSFDSGIFSEKTPYAPSSPYSASKAASDHFVRAWHHTYGLPVVLSNCSNNYGPYQFPEKLIPLIILNAMEGESLPIYGKGENVRDWLYVDDHAKALELVFTKGAVGESYNVGGRNERTNLQVAEAICDAIDLRFPRDDGRRRRELINFVPDRPGHDRRYAIDATKLETELGWQAKENFDSGLAKTIDWFMDNRWWWEPIRSGAYGGKRLSKR